MNTQVIPKLIFLKAYWKSHRKIWKNTICFSSFSVIFQVLCYQKHIYFEVTIVYHSSNFFLQTCMTSFVRLYNLHLHYRITRTNELQRIRKGVSPGTSLPNINGRHTHPTNLGSRAFVTQASTPI